MVLSRRKKQKIVGIFNRLPFVNESKKYNVTISDECRFIWYQVAKVGSRTILNSLRESGVHLSKEEGYNIYTPSKLYEGYFKFAFIRNPFDRLVSCWLNKVYRREDNRFKADPRMCSSMQTFSGFIGFVGKRSINTILA